MLSEKPWQPEQVLQLLVRLFFSWLIGTMLVSCLYSTHWLRESQLRLVALAVGTLSFHGAGLALTYAFLRRERITWDEAFGFMTPRIRRTLVLAVLVALGVLPIALSLGQLSAKVMEFFHVERVVQDPVQMLQSAGSVQAKLLIGVLAIAVAPFVEELVFRGLIYPTVKQHGFPKLALWGTSVLFAVIHSNLMIVLPLIFLALVLTWLYETTDNLLAPIVAHSCFNFVNFIYMIAQQGS
jgi:membrane protease YdiL (CAAX protease family)